MIVAENINKKIEKKEIDPTNESIGVKLGTAKILKELPDSNGCSC